jgi:hypothetical protein
MHLSRCLLVSLTSYVCRAQCFRFKRFCPMELQLSLAKWRPRSVTSEAVK